MTRLPILWFLLPIYSCRTEWTNSMLFTRKSPFQLNYRRTNTDNTDFTDSLVLCDHWCFLLNTDYTDFTDSSVLPHNGTKDPFLVFPNKKNPCNPWNPCSEPLRITELQGISTFSESIRVIREIRVQNPYAPRLNKDIRVLRQKKHPCNPWNPCSRTLRITP